MRVCSFLCVRFDKRTCTHTGSPRVRTFLDESMTYLKQNGYKENLLNLMFNGPQQTLARTENAQLRFSFTSSSLLLPRSFEY
jgi:hypothetical protein